MKKYGKTALLNNVFRGAVMRTIVFITLTAILLVLAMSFFGIAIPFFVASIVFLIMAILFSYNKQYYYTYLKLINPKYLDIINKKDEEFKKRNRQVNITSYYILSVLMFLNGQIRINNNHYSNTFLSFQRIIVIVGIAAIIGIASYFIHNYVLIKSKDNDNYVFWSILTGFIIVTTLLIFLKVL